MPNSTIKLGNLTIGNGVELCETREDLLNDIWELYKAAYGFRPRGTDFSAMTWNELFDMAEQVSAEADRVFAHEQAVEAQDLIKFEDAVQAVIAAGAGNEETALRWMTQGEEFYNGQDVEGWVYNWGILFTARGKELVRTLSKIVSYKEVDYA